MGDIGGRFAEWGGGWFRRSRRYSPFDRSLGLRRLPDNGAAWAVLCSVLLHTVLVYGLVRLTDVAPGAGDAQLVSLLPLEDPEPAPASPAPATEPASTPSPVRTPAHSAHAESRTSRPTGHSEPAIKPVHADTPVGVAKAEVPTASGKSVAAIMDPPAASPSATRGGVSLAMPEDDGSLTFGSPEPGPTATTTLAATVSEPSTALTPARVLPSTVSGPSPEDLSAFQPGSAPDSAPVAAPREQAKATAALQPTTAPVAEPPTEPTTPKQAAAEAKPVPSPRSGSPVGLRSGRLVVRLEGARARETDKSTELVTGRVVGGTPERLVFQVNGVPTEIRLGQQSFETSVPLQPGTNRLRVVASSPSAEDAEDSIVIDYTPRPISTGIALTSPTDGTVLGPDDPPVIVVEGQVDDQRVGTAWVVANDRRIPVPVRDGRFRQVVPLAALDVRVWAEAQPGDGPAYRSQAVTIHGVRTSQAGSVFVMDWPYGMTAADVEVTASWRAYPDRLDTPLVPVKLAALTPSNGTPSDAFYLRSLKPGVYTLTVRYRGAGLEAPVRTTLYLNGDASSRSLRPLPLAQAGKTVLAKILLPEAVLWEQDEWFSGRSESVDTVTKFRVPEGITWVERKADLP